MDGTRTSLRLLLLLLPLLLRHADADQDLLGVDPTGAGAGLNATVRTDAGANGTFCSCLIDTELGLIAVGSAGGLILCLLVSTIVLACQVRRLQRRVYVPRSNADMGSGTCYWEADQPEAQGLVGPCDVGVMLEEVREECEEDSQEESWEKEEEDGAGREEQGAATKTDDGQMSTSRSRDSCLEVLKDLEDMPLVV